MIRRANAPSRWSRSATEEPTGDVLGEAEVTALPVVGRPAGVRAAGEPGEVTVEAGDESVNAHAEGDRPGEGQVHAGSLPDAPDRMAAAATPLGRLSMTYVAGGNRGSQVCGKRSFQTVLQYFSRGPNRRLSLRLRVEQRPRDRVLEDVADVVQGSGVLGRGRAEVGGGCGGMSPSVSSPPPRLISDELWALVEPLIPPRPPAVHGRTGRPRTSDRDAFEGIAFVLSTGIGWAKLPTQLGYGSGWTCCGGCASGPTPASSTGCTRPCWTGWASRASWTGRGPAWTRSASEPKGGRADRPQPD